MTRRKEREKGGEKEEKEKRKRREKEEKERRKRRERERYAPYVGHIRTTYGREGEQLCT